MRLGREMRSINDWYYPNGWTPAGFARRLLDLTAGRYVVAVPEADHTADVMSPPLRLVSQTDGVRIYENSQALPRARFVPRVEVIGDDHLLLRRLAFGHDDLRRVALLEAPPPSGFIGVNDDAAGTVDFVAGEPEHVVLRVHAPDRGFLFLADQHYPGWNAWVNGARVPIMRADYAFRLVEVPAGESTVEFRYTPMSVRIGAAISALTVLALSVIALSRRGRERLGEPPHDVSVR
jgi:Bacterial membrane protein YfhO